MREIVSVQIGQGGIQLGATFWESLCMEHKLSLTTGEYVGQNDLDLERIDVYFREGAEKGRYVPRSVMVDLEPSSLDAIRSGPLGRLFNPDDYVAGRYGRSSSYRVMRSI